MLRSFTLATRKLLPRHPPMFTLASDTALSCSITNHEVLRDKQVTNHHRLIFPQTSDHNRPRLLGQNGLLSLENSRWVSGKGGFQIPDPSITTRNMINMLKCIDLKDMKHSPSPEFWVAFTAGGAQIVIPLLEIIGGYSNLLTIFQLQLAAMSVAAAGGIKWGLAISKNPNPPPTWDTMKCSLTPTLIALLGLLLPYPLGFLTVGAAQVISLYLDHTSCAFPPWGLATRVFWTLSTLAGLFMALTAYLLFDDRDRKNKKDMTTQVKEENNEEEG